MISFLLRTAHGIIDLYLARLTVGPGNLTASKRERWMEEVVSLLCKQREKSQFSTFYELNQLASHLELIIKNNVPGILELTREEYPTHLRQELNPVSPVIGASGETSGRSAQARKFRMPGYPLALISTDVFQEGEDLHTFCDSVVHYGISGSPVSIEQKTGRVDRVNSMAQRRLIALERQAQEEDFIQVTFPYVKESIETLQIRQVCTNLNKFVEELHDIGSSKIVASDVIDLNEALTSKDEIPEQILRILHSPYTAMTVEENEYNAVRSVSHNEVTRSKKVNHVFNILSRMLEIQSSDDFIGVLQKEGYDIADKKLSVKLTSAKASGELMISLTRHAEPQVHQIDDRKNLFSLMNSISWTTFHRTFAVRTDDIKNGYQLYFNAEMLVGDESMTQQNEIEMLFERMDIEHNPEDYSPELPEDILVLLNTIHDSSPIPIDRGGETKVRVLTEGDEKVIEFEFGGRQIHRRQRIKLYTSGGRCIFLSHATRAGFCNGLDVDSIIKHTWMRNRYTDLVEFVVDPQKAIAGRVVHPYSEMQWDEFIYCAYTLAVETDNLEYLLNRDDVH
jgi:hypothetical protein